MSASLPASSANSPTSLRGLGQDGLSKYHQSILSRMATDRQRFVSGKYPVICEVLETPTLKWLGRGKAAATSQLMINGTTVERSLASYDRFQWLDDDERTELHDKYALLSWELLAVITLTKPGYVSILPGTAAGSTAAASRFLDATSRWERWKLQGQVLDALESQVCSDRLWVTGFSLTGRAGFLHSMDTNNGHITTVNSRTAKSLLWPNEVSAVPEQLFSAPTLSQAADLTDKEKQFTTTTLSPPPSLRKDWKDAILVSDGFLVPGKDVGGIYVVQQPGNPNTEWTVCLTPQPKSSEDRWFYHRAVWIDLTGDGRKSILTARAKFPLGGGGNSAIANTDRSSKTDHSKSKHHSTLGGMGQLVCLEMPQPHRVDPATGTPLERDGTVFDPLSARHLPWKVHVLDEGPDVMFNVVDLDPADDTIEVIASQFFGEKVTLHSIRKGSTPQVAFRRTIDQHCGKAFGCTVADLRDAGNLDNSFVARCVIDSGSTVETLNEGDGFSHLLVTSHECSYREEQSKKKSLLPSLGHNNNHSNGVKIEVRTASSSTTTKHGSTKIDGGSLFSYKIPQNWKADEWIRTTVATGFKVQGQLNNMINPGAPGFVYTFHARQEDKDPPSRRRPLIAVAGDCAESAYIYRPSDEGSNTLDPSANYNLMCEIKCGATVGSIGVGYGDFCETEQETGYAKLYIPCYEEDKILVFGLGSGDE